MKKIIAVILSLALCLSFSACTKKVNSSGGVKIGEDEFRIEIQNKSGENIKGLTLTYYVFDEKVSSVYLGAQEGSLIADGDVLAKTFNKKDFEKFLSLADFKAECQVVNEAGESKTTINNMKLAVFYGETYYYLLDGNSKTGFHLSKLSSPISSAK